MIPSIIDCLCTINESSHFCAVWFVFLTRLSRHKFYFFLFQCCFKQKFKTFSGKYSRTSLWTWYNTIVVAMYHVFRQGCKMAFTRRFSFVWHCERGRPIVWSFGHYALRELRCLWNAGRNFDGLLDSYSTLIISPVCVKLHHLFAFPLSIKGTFLITGHCHLYPPTRSLLCEPRDVWSWT